MQDVDYKKDAGVVLAERQLPKLNVAGSIPVSRSKKMRNLWCHSSCDSSVAEFPKTLILVFGAASGIGTKAS